MSVVGTQLAREPERSKPEHMSVRLDIRTLGVILGILLQILGSVYAYGRLVERVDTLQHDVQEIRAILLQRGTK